MLLNEGAIKRSKGSGKSGLKKNQTSINNPLIDGMNLKLDNPSDTVRMMKSYNELDENQRKQVRPKLISKLKEYNMSIPQNHPIKKDMVD